MKSFDLIFFYKFGIYIKIFHVVVLYFCVSDFIFILILWLPLSKRSAELATVQLHPILVEYAEHRAATLEAADLPDVINSIVVVIHIDDVPLTINSFLGCWTLGWLDAWLDA